MIFASLFKINIISESTADFNQLTFGSFKDLRVSQIFFYGELKFRETDGIFIK